ncbi:MAG: hypothetical protein JWM76_776 [Pseudonocardiales bacterium]|nr:hypothetical protein [Pseudonocardiales bacterium]
MPSAELDHETRSRASERESTSQPAPAGAFELAEPLLQRRPVPVAGLAVRKVDATPPLTQPPTRAVSTLADDVQIRRLVSVRGHRDTLGAPLQSVDKLDDDFEALIDAVDKMTTKAWSQVVNRPLFTGLEELAEASGYLAKWVENMREATDLGYAGKMGAAQFGYAVETLTTHLLGKTAAGWNLSYQIAVGATRPDIVATKGDRTVWVDLTSGSVHSHAHIYVLKEWNLPLVCPYPHAEVTYPAFETPLMNTMIANAKLEIAKTPKDGEVDAGALVAEIAAAREKLAANLIRWNKTYRGPLLREARRADSFERGNFDDEMARNSVYKWLNYEFGKNYELTQSTSTRGGARRNIPKVSKNPYDRPAKSYGRGKPESEDERGIRLWEEKGATAKQDEDSREASSILTALKIDPSDYGFVITTLSRARGIAFLEEQDRKEAERKAAATSTV